MSPGADERGPGPTVRRLAARTAPDLVAVLDELRPLFYDDGGALTEDRPAHLRAASSARRFGGRLAIVQDDVNVLALRAAGGAVESVLLPRGAGGQRVFGDARGNKHAKLDLEAATVLPDGRLVAFGSGSTAERERLVIVDRAGRVTVREATDLYAVLRATTTFAGSELNVEGALVSGSRLLLAQRGNGAPVGSSPERSDRRPTIPGEVAASRLLSDRQPSDRQPGDRQPTAREVSEAGPIDALGELVLAEFLAWLDDAGPPPHLAAVLQLDLGRIGSVRRTLTDLAHVPQGPSSLDPRRRPPAVSPEASRASPDHVVRAEAPRPAPGCDQAGEVATPEEVDPTLAFVTCAERSPDTTRDGEVVGSDFGLLRGDELSLVPVVDIRGEPVRLKIEGLEPRLDAGGGGDWLFDVVIDADREEAPALLGCLRVSTGGAAGQGHLAPAHGGTSDDGLAGAGTPGRSADAAAAFLLERSGGVGFAAAAGAGVAGVEVPPPAADRVGGLPAGAARPISDLSRLLANLEPTLEPGVWVYACLPAGSDPAPLAPLATFREREGLTVIVDEATALAAGLTVVFRAAWITLTVPSDLAAVGLTAAFAGALGAAGISCNVVAAACHDHLFVPVERAAEAMAALHQLQRSARAAGDPPG